MFCSKICSNIFRKGQSPWNKGKADIICLQCGTTFTRTRKTSKYCSVHCFGQSQRGDKHRNWKGGKPKISRQKTLSYDEYRKYRDWQKAVFSRDKYKCVFCGASKVELHADHIKPYASHVDLRWEINNGRTLCVTCHRKTPTYGGNTRASKKDI
jgi:5-methylcytosine-specific restriction endonuclease McrA